ncbi:MAG: glycosyltransferase, partial [Gallionella sp.]
RLELIAYTNSPKEDDLTRRIKPHFAHWREIYALGDQAAAQLIHDDGIHVLLDLSGHTAYNRLPVFAWKPAPIQTTWLGYFASTGVAEMDYILGDKWLLPENEANHFIEKGWQLAGAHSCLTPPAEQVSTATLPALRSQTITFGTLNNLAKMNDRVVACWARILTSIPNSQLYFNTKALHDETVKRSIIDRYAAHGIAANRLILESTTGRLAALNSYNRIDIALDPFPYPGGTTSYEALWMGVPILTMQGHNYISHLGESILHNAGLPDWIARDEDDYVAKAIQFAGDLPKLAALRAGLREQVLASPLFNASRFAKHFEEALWGMWQAKQPALVGALQSPPSPSSSHQAHPA